MNSFLTKNSQPAEPGIEVVKAKGSIFWDKRGKDYVDFSSQTLNLNFGQCNPVLNRAALKQMKNYTFLSSRFVVKPMEDLAKKLVGLAPKGMTKVNLKLTNGSDANESAFKRVRKFHGKNLIASFLWSHHGETGETIDSSGKHFENRSYIGGGNDYVFFDPPHKEFFPHCRKSDEVEDASLDQLETLLKTKHGICAVIVEPVLVNAGVYILSPRYAKLLRKLCDQYKISLIFDEIQTAFGWLGKFFASDLLGVTPDLMTIGKGLASGFPLAGILMMPEYDVLDYGEDEFTYGGYPMSCAVALENLRLLKTMSLEKIVFAKSELVRKFLARLQEKDLSIKEVRGRGLIWAVDFGKSSQLKVNEIYKKAILNGLVLRKSRDGFGTSLVIKPPINTPNKILKLGLERFGAALK